MTGEGNDRMSGRRIPRRLRPAELDGIGRRVRGGEEIASDEAEDLVYTATILDAKAGSLTDLCGRLKRFLVRRGLWEACDREMELWRLRREMGPRQTTLDFSGGER